MTQYYYLEPDGQTVRGPYEPAALRAEWTRRNLPASTLCCRAGTETWKTFDSVVDELYTTRHQSPQPAAPTQKPSDPLNAWLIVAALGGAALILIVHSVGNSQRDMRFDAYYTATEQWIRPRMKNPSAAKFSPYTDSTVDVNGTSYEVNGWVEGTNSFGATMRQPFSCRMHTTGDGEQWISDSLNVR